MEKLLLPIKKINDLIIINRLHSIVIGKISGFSLNKMSTEPGKFTHILSIVYDGIKLDFSHENEEMMYNTYNRLMELYLNKGVDYVQ